MSDQISYANSASTSSAREERFTLRLVDAGVRTEPDALPCPLLARLHGFDRYDPENPPDVSEVINAAEVLNDSEMRDWLSGMTARILDIAPSNGVVVDVVERTDLVVRMRIRDADEVALEGVIDISVQAAQAGLPIHALLLKDGRVSLRSCAPKGQLVILDAASNVKEEAERIAASIAALSEAYPDPDRTFFSLPDFLEKQGDGTPWSFGRSLYKYTDCGPWVAFVVPEHARGSVYYEDREARDEAAPWWPACVGVTIGSIVEGSDAEVQPETLLWPFTQDSLDRAVKNVNDEACALWEEANGAEDGDEEV